MPKSPATPFPLPGELPRRLRRVFDYWHGLLRGGADMPFWDDATLTALPDLAPQLFLLGVFALPQRFRFEQVGDKCRAEGSGNIVGRFVDEIEREPPFAFLQSQSCAAVESQAPNFYAADGTPGPGYARLLLPMWGDGRVGMILGAIEWH